MVTVSESPPLPVSQPFSAALLVMALLSLLQALLVPFSMKKLYSLQPFLKVQILKGTWP